MQTQHAATDFCETTSAHGFSHLTTKNITKRVFWLLIISGGYIGLTIEFYNIFSIYFTYSKIWNEETVVNSFLFPDLTFCPTEQLSLTKENNFPDTKPWLKFSQKMRHLTVTLNSVAYMSNKTEDFELPDITSKVLRSIADKHDMFFSAQDHIISCTYMNRFCDFRNFTLYWHPTRFACYRFVPDERHAHISGPGTGLKLLLNPGKTVNVKTDQELVNFVTGYAISIHSPGTRPSFRNGRIKVARGSLVEVEVGVENRYDISTPTRPCFKKLPRINLTTEFSKSPPTTEAFEQTYKECRDIAAQENMIAQCNCIDEARIVPSKLFQNVSLCYETPDELIYFTKASAVLGKKYTIINVGYKGKKYSLHKFVEGSKYFERVTCYRNVSFQFLSKEISSDDCAKPCNSIIYHTSVFTQSSPPKDEVLRVLKKSVDKAYSKAIARGYNITDRNPTNLSELVRINIYPGSVDSVEKRASLAMTPSTLLATIGGSMGLWSGFSLMTLGELLQFVINLHQ